MAKGKALLAAMLATVSVPALASVTVIGTSSARVCFEAADSPMMPSFRHLQRCDKALNEEQLSLYETVATHVNRGILRLRRGQVDEAIADFDRAMALDPEQPEAYLNKGAALIRRNNPSDALGLFTVALERNTSRPAIAHYGRGVANEALGNIRQAYFDYRRASELAPEWAEPRTELQRFRVVGR